MIGAIAGDIIGSVYEFGHIKSKEFPLFGPESRYTDDSVLTVAIAQAILTDGDYRRAVLDLGRRYPDAGYGGFFRGWLDSPDPKPYNSWGNGSAMRVSPVGFAFESVEDVLREAQRSAEFTHDHPEGIKGAQATALAVFLARTEWDKDLIRHEITDPVRLRPRPHRRRDPPRLRLRRVLPADRPRGDHRLPRFRILRGRHPERDLPRRRQRHARLHRGRHRRGLSTARSRP